MQICISAVHFACFVLLDLNGSFITRNNISTHLVTKIRGSVYFRGNIACSFVSKLQVSGSVKNCV